MKGDDCKSGSATTFDFFAAFLNPLTIIWVDRLSMHHDSAIIDNGSSEESHVRFAPAESGDLALIPSNI